MDSMKRYKRSFGTVLALFLLLVLWMIWPDGRLAKVQALQKELFSTEGKKLSSEDRKGKFQELREVSKNLSPAQKQELAKEGQKRVEQDLERYAKMSKKEQIAHLDQQIDRMQQFAKKGPPPANGQGKGGFAKNAKPTSAEEKERMRKQRLDHSTPEFRALTDRFRKDMQARLTARGINLTRR